MPDTTKIISKHKKVVIVGTGAVATTFISHFLSQDISVVQQFGRTIPKNPRLPFTNDYKNIRTDADLYIIAVSDDAISEIVKYFPKVNGIVVHTAGSVRLDILRSKFKNCGVLYPLQSFSKNRNFDFQSIPFLLEANNKETENSLNSFIHQMADNIQIVTYDERLQIHLAAVFASNFSNHMNTIAQEILSEKNIDVSLLKPLLQETCDKILTSNPKDAQTGPAKRNDVKILEKHSQMLASNPNFQEIYKLVSKSITDFHKE